MSRTLVYEEVIERIGIGRNYITTNEDISEYNYVKCGKRNAIQMWVLREWQYSAIVKWRKKNSEYDADYYAEHKEHSQEMPAKWEREHSFERNVYNTTGVRRERRKIRAKDLRKYCSEVAIIPYLVDIHHEWVSGTAQPRGAAVVELEAHQHGIIEVAKLLYGE